MKYHIHVTSSDSLGMNMIENIVELAGMGAKLKEGTVPYMRFPHSCSMVLEADQPPTPSAVVRVFELETGKEVFAALAEAKAASFSMDEVSVDLSTNNGEPWTKEQLEAMDFETEFRAVCASVGVKGRSRDKMIKEFLAIQAK